MFSKSKLGLAVLAVLCVSDGALGRIRWMERDDRAILLHPRRFGQENPAVIQKLSAACPGQVCGSLSGEAITPLLAAQPECSQQDMADKIIDAAQQFDAATKANMIAIAVEYRQAEKNTPPDFTTNPPTPRNSVFCQKAPKNPELNGLVQAQDPANGDVFFDPATKASVQRGAQPNTAPFGGAAGGNGGANNGGNAGANNGGNTGANNGNAGGAAGNDGTAGGANNGQAVGANNGNAGGAAGAIGDFGSCSVPEIEFGVGFDNRKETSFRPVDLNSFNHGSAQAIGIITTFVCDQLVNKCGADQTAKDTCAKAKAAANGGAAKTGIQADLFNAAFGKKTNFAGVQAIDDQGRAVGGAGGNTGAANLDTQTGNAGNTGNNAVAAGGIGDFGSCSIPEVEFGAGFEGRKETSFQPKDKNSFNHGSAQAFGIISQFICDTLTNKCGADQAAKDTCAKATAAANAAPAKTGKQADAFNAAFGIQTNFGAVQAIDNQGRPVAGTGAGNAGGNTGNAGAGNNGNANAGNNAGNTGTGNANTGNTGAANTGNAGAGGNLQTFTGALGGVVAPTVTASGNGDFQVQGNASFKALRSAVVRSCDVQNNQCANAANSSGNKGDLTVTNCNAQQQRCIAAAPQ